MLVRIKDLNCIGCFECVLACPSGAIKPAEATLVPIAKVKETGWKRGESPHPNRVKIITESCKGCRLCVDVCGEERNAVEVKVKKDA